MEGLQRHERSLFQALAGSNYSHNPITSFYSIQDLNYTMKNPSRKASRDLCPPLPSITKLKATRRLNDRLPVHLAELRTEHLDPDTSPLKGFTDFADHLHRVKKEAIRRAFIEDEAEEDKGEG